MRVHFFSYGAFDQDQVHYSKLANFIVSKQSAFIKSEMYLLRSGYPVLVESEEKNLIEGICLELEIPENYWSILDQLIGYDPQKPEKSFFHRYSVPVMIDNFSHLEAFTYGLNPKKLTSAHKKITDNNWKKSLQTCPPMANQLQERQKIYIQKLSKSKGRDIVPIKMDLYRELMNLEMIVDKGRRLALTPLGKETALFL